MRTSQLGVIALLLVFGAAAPPAQAGETRAVQPPTGNPTLPGPPDTASLRVGIGMICNTSDQAESYVKLRARGSETSAAMDSVNRQANDPKACGMAAIAYRRDKTMDTRNLNGKLIDIVRIDVLAGYDGHGWTRMQQRMTQYAIVPSEGMAI